MFDEIFIPSFRQELDVIFVWVKSHHSSWTSPLQVMLISDILGNSLSAAILIHTHQINNYLSFWVWSIICFPSRLVDEIPQVVSFLIFNVGQKMFLSAIEKQTEIKCLWLYLFGNGPIFVSRLVRWTRFLGGQFSHIWCRSENISLYYTLLRCYHWF